jgi:GT2 family glycosyltransferase
VYRSSYRGADASLNCRELDFERAPRTIRVCSTVGPVVSNRYGIVPNSVSVIIPCVGWSESLLACIESVRQQKINLRLEIVVVINGPRKQEAQGLPSGVTIVHEPRQGPAAARNRGVEASTGDVLAFIDSDCIATPTWLTSALTTMTQGAFGSIVAGAIGRSRARQNWVSFYDSVNYLQQERYVNGPGACATANALVARWLFDRIGPFDERFKEAAFEDWDWVLRARKLGVSVAYDANAQVDHPCMFRVRDLKGKAERLARGERLWQLKNGRDSVPALLTRIKNQIRCVRSEGISVADRVRLMCVGVASGFWMWSATRLEAHLDESERQHKSS